MEDKPFRFTYRFVCPECGKTCALIDHTTIETRSIVTELEVDRDTEYEPYVHPVEGTNRGAQSELYAHWYTCSNCEQVFDSRELSVMLDAKYLTVFEGKDDDNSDTENED